MLGGPDNIAIRKVGVVNGCDPNLVDRNHGESKISRGTDKSLFKRTVL